MAIPELDGLTTVPIAGVFFRQYRIITPICLEKFGFAFFASEWHGTC
jgi:hypothetical protein